MVSFPWGGFEERDDEDAIVHEGNGGTEDDQALDAVFVFWVEGTIISKSEVWESEGKVWTRGRCDEHSAELRSIWFRSASFLGDLPHFRTPLLHSSDPGA